VFARPQGRDSFLVGRVTGQVKSTQALDGREFAIGQGRGQGEYRWPDPGP